MCRLQCLLALLAVSLNCVYSWDIAISTGDKLEFYNEGNRTHKVADRTRDLTALAYDAVRNMLLFVDKQDDNASIFRYYLSTNDPQALVGKKSYEDIQGLAFDPITEMLFWTDINDKSIYWKSLKAGSKNEVYGNLLIKFDDKIPRAIAVDSCRGYIYWTNTNIMKPSIERARLDGTNVETIVSSDIYMPVSIAVDQRTKKLYWADDKEGIHFSIESSDLDGKNRVTLLKGINHQPNALTVSKDDVYWIDWGYTSVWKLPKGTIDAQRDPTQVLNFSGRPFGIIANYTIEDQTTGIAECETLKNLSQNNSVINDFHNIPTGSGVHCLHGVKISGTLTCNCSLGYTGERCEIPVCLNYCLNGNCSVSTDGQPKCSCENGYSGSRCDVDMCHGRCLNNGRCVVMQGKTTCQCVGEYEGDRCETLRTKTIPLPVPSEPCNCTQEPQNTTKPVSAQTTENLSADDGEFVESCNSGWDPVRDPILMVLGVLCGLLCVACTYLITKVLQLKKRPRIKKRIIVNKNVTPLTARPDQCEITIENCCNMNICETPCFEPRSTIRPTLLDAKPGKEEKRNLISNMELPDD